jgi:hypothetical protein
MAKSFSQNEKAPCRGFSTLAHAGDPTPVNWIGQIIYYVNAFGKPFYPPQTRARQAMKTRCSTMFPASGKWFNPAMSARFVDANKTIRLGVRLFLSAPSAFFAVKLKT